jgi:hypothetical protein
MSPTDNIRWLLLQDPDLSIADIQSNLRRLNQPVPSEFLISQVRSNFRRDMKVLDQAGLLRHRSPELPALFRSRSNRKIACRRLPKLSKKTQRYGYDSLDD